MGGRTYPVRYYPVAIRLRDRNSTPHQFTKLVGDPVGRAILCIALFPQSGDSSGAILGVRSVALLHEATATLRSPNTTKSHLKVNFLLDLFVFVRIFLYLCTLIVYYE